MKVVVAACDWLTTNISASGMTPSIWISREKLLTMIFPMAFGGGVIYNVNLMHLSGNMFRRAN